ncbi:hypothetical protein SAMN04489711_1372 [Paracidovorax wautersii]|uniref:Uncharacterized protein n=2 Tax=Paracidovorax wautersii TaxID=1177982 RepID=A0A1I2HUX3_9BURK|nr:hypothetical protein SAMN04489711_1372 [Paracidovorax wautersii]
MGATIAQVALFHDRDGKLAPRVLVNEFRLGLKKRMDSTAFEGARVEYYNPDAVAAFMLGQDVRWKTIDTFYTDMLDSDDIYCDEISIEDSDAYDGIRAAHGDATPTRICVAYQFCLPAEKEQVIARLLAAERESVGALATRFSQEWARLHEFDPGLPVPTAVPLSDELANQVADILESHVERTRQDAGSAAAREALEMISADVMAGDSNGLADIDVAIAALLQARSKVSAALVNAQVQEKGVTAAAPTPATSADRSPAPGL